MLGIELGSNDCAALEAKKAKLLEDLKEQEEADEKKPARPLCGVQPAQISRNWSRVWICFLKTP